MSTSTLPEGLSPAEIDAVVSARVAAGEDLYRLDEGALAELDADVVLTQDLCAVCAVDLDRVDDALTYLGCTARVLTLDPQSLDDVVRSVLDVGDALDASERAREVVDSLRARLDVLGRSLAGAEAAIGARPRVDRPAVLCRALGPRSGGGGWWHRGPRSPGRRLAADHVGRGPIGARRRGAGRSVRLPPRARRRPSPSSSSPTIDFPSAPRCGRSTPTATSSGRVRVSSTARRRSRRSCIPGSSERRPLTARDASTMGCSRRVNRIALCEAGHTWPATSPNAVCVPMCSESQRVAWRACPL